MDLKIFLLSCALAICLYASTCEAGHKKIVIHVPLKIKKLKHTHTIYKTIHHYHTHTDHHHKHDKNDGDEEEGHYDLPDSHEDEMEDDSSHGSHGNEQEEHVHHHHVHNDVRGSVSESRLPVSHNRYYPNTIHHNRQQGNHAIRGSQSSHRAQQGYNKALRVGHGQRRFLEDTRLHQDIEDYPDQSLQNPDADEENDMKRKRSVAKS